MPKKLLIFIFVVILVLIVLGVLYYIGMLSQEPQGFIEKNNEFVSISLIRIPAGSEIDQEMDGVETSSFEKGDLIKIEGEIKLAKGKDKAVLTSQVLDNEGKVLGQIYTPEMEIKTVNFGSCCIRVPEGVGEYTLKFFLDSKETKLVNFEVIE
jgi:sporulation protein YlmC with PRC-barrel domain